MTATSVHQDTLRPGASRRLFVRFAPRQAGAYRTVLTLTSSDPRQPLRVIRIQAGAR